MWAIDQSRLDYKASAAPAGGADRIAVIPLVGYIGAHARDEWVDTGIDAVSASFASAVADKSVRAVVMYVDSPGGTVTGVPEFAEQVYAARSEKKIIAVVDSLAASAAYWIASAATQVVMPASGEVGSIGVFMMHADASKALENFGVKLTFIHAGKHKVEGNFAEPLSDESKAYLQERVDTLHGDFIKAVAKHRGVTASVVREKFGQGRTVNGKDAVALGMADRIGSFGETMDRLTTQARNAKMRAALRREWLEERLG